MNTKRQKTRRPRLTALVAAALFASIAVTTANVSSAAAATDKWLCAKGGTASIANPADGGLTNVSVSFTGFVEVPSAADCATAVPRLGDPTPMRLTEGVTYNIHVVNQAGFAINMVAVGLSGAPDLIGIAPGASGAYEVTPAVPGTYMYESDLDPRHSLLGLHGVIVVDPAAGPTSAHGTAVSTYDTEQIIVITEVDVDLNNAADPFAVDSLAYDPDLFLINGQTNTTNVQVPPLVVDPGERVLLRYINASPANNTMTVVGLRQELVAFDGEIQEGSAVAVGETPLDVSNVFLSAGQTADAMVTVFGSPGQRIPIYNRNLLTSAVGDNGAQLMFLQVNTGGLTAHSKIYFSLNNAVRNMGGVVIRDEDVARWDGTNVTMFFQGAAHGLIDNGANLADIDGVDVGRTTGDVWFSLRQDFPRPGGALDPSNPHAAEWAGVAGDVLQENDVFRYDASTGLMSIWLDGSAIGLNDLSNIHDINGLDVDPVTGVTNFTTNGNISPFHNVPLFTGSTTTFGAMNEDVIRWTPDVAAAPSGAGSLSVVADLSDLGLAGENIDAVALTPTDVMFSTTNEYPNPPATPDFDRDDLVACLGHQPPAAGSVTDTCFGPLSVQFDADTLNAGGIAGQVDAYAIG